MYGQIISFLFLILILYYAVMIFLDIQKAKAAKAAEQDKNNEEEIDISDEASTFKPVMITRDETPKTKTESDNIPESEFAPAQKGEEKPEPNIEDKAPTEEKDSHTATEKSVEDTPTSTTNDSSEEETPRPAEKHFKRPGYREPIMTGYISADELIEEANKLAETGRWDLGNLIVSCVNAA